MPAKSKKQQRLFGLALSYKRGELEDSDVNDTVKDLSELPEETLKKYTSTKHTDLPDKIEEMLGSSFSSSPTQGDFGGGNLPYNRTKKRWSQNLLKRSNKYKQDLQDKPEDEEFETFDDGIITYSEFIKRQKGLEENEGSPSTVLNTPGMGNVTPGGESGVGSGDVFPSFSDWYEEEDGDEEE